MITRIISIFLESAAQDVEKMRVAVLAGDPEGLAVAAYSLKVTWAHRACGSFV
jgi:hypothetical protein